MADLKAMFAKRTPSIRSAPSEGLAQSASAEVATGSSPPESPPPPKVNALAKRFGKVKATDPVTAPGHTDLMIAPESIDKAIDEMDLSDLAELDSSEGYADTSNQRSQFTDEIPATAPARMVPADADKGMIQFVQLIDGVYQLLSDPELLGSVIRNIMVELKTHPEYMKQVQKEDVRVWVQAMRNSMGLARVKKQEAKAKRGAGKKAKPTDADFDDAFAELGIKID